MENEADIIRALQRGVTAAVAQSDNPSLPVKYLLVGETDGTAWKGIPNDQKWIELIWIPNNSDDFRDNAMNHRGILRIVLHWPNEGGGVYPPVQLLASVTRYFEKGKLLSGVQIYRKPQPTGIIEDGDDILFPVSVFYQSYRKGA